MKIRTIEEFITALKVLHASLKEPDDIINLWFRGESQNDILTPLMPKAYRLYNDPNEEEVYNQTKSIEGNFKAEFGRYSLPYLSSKGIPINNWNEYMLMQHYGLKTRLLDWSESALIALFFATENLSDNDGRVWIMNPHKLNKYTTDKIHPNNEGFDLILTPTEGEKTSLFDESKKWHINELLRMYLEMDFNLNKTKTHFYPLAILPPLLDERMSMQNSCFTIFGNVVNGLLKIRGNEEFLDYLIIDKNFKRTIKEELRWLGISQRNIFPGLEGISKSIGDKYNMDHLILKRTI
jgi:hypothetical protein